MVLRGKLKQVLVEAYKNKHPAPLDNVYSELIIEKKKKKKILSNIDKPAKVCFADSTQ